MSELILSLCIPDSPSSFRDAADSRLWRSMIADSHHHYQNSEKLLFGTNAVKFPVSCAVSLKVLHLHAGEATKRDVDNTAKPIMDEFTRLVYHDDSQVKSLTFQSAPFFSKLALDTIRENNVFFGGLLTNLMLKHSGDSKISDVTIIELRDISSEMRETNEEFFLHLNKISAQNIIG